MLRPFLFSSPFALFNSYFSGSIQSPGELSATTPRERKEAAKRLMGRTDDPLWCGANEKGRDVWLFYARNFA